jgi:methylase of polypeptide subunit release factors
MNKLRIPLIRDALVDNMDSLSHILPLKDKHILDVGSGGGIIAEVCSNERQDGIIHHFIKGIMWCCLKCMLYNIKMLSKMNSLYVVLSEMYAL